MVIHLGNRSGSIHETQHESTSITRLGLVFYQRGPMILYVLSRRTTIDELMSIDPQTHRS